MIVDGRAIAAVIKEELRQELAASPKRPSLGVVVATSDLATRKFVERKEHFGTSIGVKIDIRELLSSATTEELTNAIREMAKIHSGIVVQLPLPSGADVDAVRNAIPVTHDVDAISDLAVKQFEQETLPILPPVVGAIAEIVRRHSIIISDKHVVVIGSGRLVGKPAVVWFRQRGAEVTTIERTSRVEDVTIEADIIVLGAGSPGLLKPHMIKDGAVILDAGTSEASGKLSGDADATCAEKASLFTPVPGGIGPITVAMIFRNLLTLSMKS